MTKKINCVEDMKHELPTCTLSTIRQSFIASDYFGARHITIYKKKMKNKMLKKKFIW